jgi:hypothetical protein
MKTKPLILIGTVLALSSLSLPFIISETSPKPEIPKMPNLELIDELVDLGCTEPAINHVSRYSNLLDDSFDGTYSIDWIGLPDDLSQVEFDKCVKIILEKRISVGLESENHQLDEPFEIKMDQRIQFEDLELYFYDIEDSRCPLDVTCEMPLRCYVCLGGQSSRYVKY